VWCRLRIAIAPRQFAPASLKKFSSRKKIYSRLSDTIRQTRVI